MMIGMIDLATGITVDRADMNETSEAGETDTDEPPDS